VKYEDFNLTDILLIKSNAIDILVTTRISNRYEALAESLLSCIYAKGYKLTPYPDNLTQVFKKHFEHVGINLSPEEVIRQMFDFLEAQKIVISRDGTRESTWFEARPGLYTPYDNKKKPWVM